MADQRVKESAKIIDENEITFDEKPSKIMNDIGGERTKKIESMLHEGGVLDEKPSTSCKDCSTSECPSQETQNLEENTKKNKIKDTQNDGSDCNVSHASRSSDDDAKRQCDCNCQGERKMNCYDANFRYNICLAVICLLTAITRSYKIDQPAHICWDETHFGKFANHYLNGTFFFDVHPPLGKMLLALSGWATGYNGTFPFDKPGDSYGDYNVVGMRMFCTTLGGLCVPLVYLTVWELTRSLMACVLSASFVLFDTGCTTISRYILLDPLLMFFVMMSIYSLVKFHSWKNCPFTFDWWGWMLCTGYFLACAFSVKWVGLFVILFAGVSTAHDLWVMLGDLSLSMLTIMKHLVARVIGLIIVPVMVYLSFFGLHFQYLPYTGTGDGFFSSSFQSTLIGNTLHKATLPAELAYGATITLKNYASSGTLLHSHPSLYPKEHPAEQQQITGYSHKDHNNDWKVHKADRVSTEDDELELVHDGDIVRLMHLATGRNLHSHHEKAPVTTNLMQVTGYGEKGTGDTNDLWRIQVVRHPGKGGLITTVKTVFRLVHVNTGCGLTETGNQLPKWGFDQREMACNPIPHLDGTNWNVESNIHKQVRKVSIELLAPTFLESVYESHIVMAKTNNGFKPKEGEFNSVPWHWPINYRGQVFSGQDFRVYLLGNPVIWWGILTIYAVFAIYFFFFEIRSRRGYSMDPKIRAKSNLVVNTCGWLLVGWCLHYLPFYLMGRVLYFHHYFPSYLISAMLSGILLEHVFQISSLWLPDKYQHLQKKIYYGCVAVTLLICIVSFYMFRGLTYGMSGPGATHPNATQAAYKWLDSWEI